jgi:hypothetical protein
VTRQLQEAAVRSRGINTRLVPILVVVLALTVLGLAGVGSFQAAGSGARALGPFGATAHDRSSHYHQITVLRREFEDRVPAGNRIVVVLPPEFGDWLHRIVEFAVMHDVVVVTDTPRAQLRVSVLAAPNSADGTGLRLVVEPLR